MQVGQQHNAIDKTSISRVSQSLESIKRTLMAFESFVAYELTIVEDDGSHTRLDKSSWLLAEPKVQKLKNQIQVHKADLCLESRLFTQYCLFL